MSIIMPAGNGRNDWFPKDKLTKVASSNGQEVDSRDLLYQEAKRIVANMNEECCEDHLAFDDVQAPLNEVAEEPVSDVSDVAGDDVVSGDTDAILAKLTAALAEATAALADAKAKLEGPSAVTPSSPSDIAVEEPKEVEIEIEKPEAEEIEIEIEDENGDEDDEDKDEECEKGDEECEDEEGDDEIIVESEEGDDDTSERRASSNDWVKLSAISPNNRKKLYDYWTKQLGYPQDFVKLMVKDYEK